MTKPNMPNMPNIPGMGAMTDTLDFVKNLWGSMGIPIPGMTGMTGMTGMNIPGMSGMNMPGMVMPTLSVEEINKKITDLKAVESWLGLNMNMLRGTIQALEVQAATISTLQTMGETFTASMNPGAKERSSAATSSSAGASNGSNGSSGSDSMHGADRQHHATPEPTTRDETDAATLTAPLVNAAAWWNMLQDQFKQAVSGAMTEVPTSATPAAEKPKSRTAKPKAAAAPSTTASTAARKRKTK